MLIEDLLDEAEARAARLEEALAGLVAAVEVYNTSMKPNIWGQHAIRAALTQAHEAMKRDA